MSISTTILLGGGPELAKRGLKQLRDNVARTGTQNVSGQKTFEFKDMGSRTWQLLGATSQKSTADRMNLFCEQHIPVLERYNDLLEQMNQELVAQAHAVITCANTQNMYDLLGPMQDDVRSRVAVIVDLLNTFDTSSGYLFSGAQSDQAAVNDQLVPDLCQEGGPNLTQGEIADYFLNGQTPNVQLPLTLMFESKFSLDLPLAANDMQDIFQAFKDLLELTPETARDGITAFQAAFDTALARLENAILKTSDLLNAFQGKESAAQSVQNETQNEIDLLVDVETVDSSLDFYNASKALETYLQFIIFLNAGNQKLRQMTEAAMMT